MKNVMTLRVLKQVVTAVNFGTPVCLLFGKRPERHIIKSIQGKGELI